jgi:hypothetical protein
LKCDDPPPADMSSSKDALRAVTEFLGAITAVRESGIVRPLHGLLAALPGLLRLAVRYNQLLGELSEANPKPKATTLEFGGTQRNAGAVCRRRNGGPDRIHASTLCAASCGTLPARRQSMAAARSARVL